MAQAGRAGTPGWGSVSMRTWAILALLVAVVMWGTSFIAAWRVLDDLPPITLAFARFALAQALLLPLLARRGLRPVRSRDAMLLGFFGVALLFTTQNAGVGLAGAADASLILGGGVPVLTAVLARVVLRETLRPRALAGVLASVGGVALVFLAAIGEARGSLRGDLLLLLSAASAAAYVVLGRKAFARYDLLAILAGSAQWGLLMLAPFVAIEVATTTVAMPSTGSWALLAYLGIGCSGIAYLLSAFSLRHLAASEASVIANLEVVVGLGAAGAILGEPLVGAQVAGGALIVSGAWLASTAPRAAATGSRRRLLARARATAA